jgi:hypothetical protein
VSDEPKPRRKKPPFPRYLTEAIDDCIIAGNHLAAYLNKDHPPFTMSLTDGIAAYGSPTAMFQLWAGCRGIARLRAAKDEIDKRAAVRTVRQAGGS